MFKNTTTSSFRKLPAAVLITAALFVMVEAFLYLNMADLVKDYWNKFLINERVLLSLPKDYGYLMIGDSIQKTGIDPTAVDEDLLNLGLPGGKPMSQYLLLKRYLESHKPPKAVFLYVDPEFPADSLLVILRYFVTIPEFISIWSDLNWTERRIFFMKYWASLDLRKLQPSRRADYKGTNGQFIETLVKNRGYMPSPMADRSLDDHYFSTHKERYQSDISFTRTDLKYLDKLVELARSKGIKVVFIGFVLPKELYAILEKTGFNKRYLDFFRFLEQRYNDALFVKSNLLYLDNRFFGDPSHVNSEGAKLYTEYFKNQIFMPAKAAIEKR